MLKWASSGSTFDSADSTFKETELRKSSVSNADISSSGGICQLSQVSRLSDSLTVKRVTTRVTDSNSITHSTGVTGSTKLTDY